MNQHGDICVCGHARHFHALKHVAGGYRSDECWADSCYCIEFEHEAPATSPAAEQNACGPAVKPPAVTGETDRPLTPSLLAGVGGPPLSVSETSCDRRCPNTPVARPTQEVVPGEPFPE